MLCTGTIIHIQKPRGVIAGCGELNQARLVYEVVTDAIKGKVEYGTGRTFGTADGYVEFVADDPDFINTVPEALRKKMEGLVDSIVRGSLVLEVPEL